MRVRKDFGEAPVKKRPDSQSPLGLPVGVVAVGVVFFFSVFHCERRMMLVLELGVVSVAP